ncbi:MAG TPA: hypothetical protein VF508_02970 [Pyrinomonadaceae bacterium]|jgi:hypothetical protein
MRLATNRGLSFFTLLILCFAAGSASEARAAVFRDRASFEAAAQNLRTIDFEGTTPGRFAIDHTADGVRFYSIGGLAAERDGNSNNTILTAITVGEITLLTIYLPPGTTAVGCDQFSRPMIVSASSGESVTMTQSDGSNFVGFVSGQPIQTLTVTLDFPEPTPNAVLDNLTYGQRRAGNEPPAPLLLTNSLNGRAAAFDSVALTSEPFDTSTPHTRNLAADGRTRVTLLVVGVRLDAPGEAAFVSARATDAQQRSFDLPVEAVGGAKNLSWLAQVTVRLPEELSGAGDVSVTVTVRGVQSNAVTLRVN